MQIQLTSLAIHCVVFVLTASAVWAQSTPPDGPGTTNRLSVTADGSAANASSGKALISSNGRLVVFESDATNLVSGDANGKRDIFLRNQKTGSIRRLSEQLGHIDSDGDSFDPSVSPESPNGFVAVAFASDATNINFPSFVSDQNSLSDIYISLPELNFTMLVSNAAGAAQANGASVHPSVTIIPAPDRVVVAYASDASNLVSSDSNGLRDIFVTTLIRPGPSDSFNPRTDVRTIKISNGASGVDANGASDFPRVSGDGRFVVFQSQATNLISGQTTAGWQIFLYDIKTQTITLISKSSAGVFGNGDSVRPAINYTGNVISYKTAASNILEDGLSVPPGAA